jgi:hypothetical protein
METEAPARPASRWPAWLLGALVLAVAAAAAAQLWPANPAAPAGATSNPRAAAQKTAEAMDPAELEVRLDALQAERPDAKATDRNPFRFQPKAPPPPPPPPPAPVNPAPQLPVVPVGPPSPPPIPLKFIGTVEPKPGDKVAAFSDCRYTFRGREGDVIDGRYRVVKIGVESAVLEYVNGRGSTTIRLTGQECVGK